MKCDPIEIFLTVNAQEIKEPYRSKLREAAATAIQTDKSLICLNHCPAHLRDAFRRIIIEAAYKVRVRGKIFQSDKKEIWI